MTEKPLIELTVDEMDVNKPARCTPYVWIVRINNQSGCAVETDYYSPEEASDKLCEFLNQIGCILFRTVFEATSCRLRGIEGQGALDAIAMGIAKYFEEDDCLVDTAGYRAASDVDFVIITDWDGEADRFTLRANGEIEYPDK